MTHSFYGIPDEELRHLLERVFWKSKDNLAVEELDTLVRPVAAKVARKVLGDWKAGEAIEDLVEKVIKQAMRGMLHERDNPKGYIIILLRNGCRDIKRGPNAQKRGGTRIHVSIDDRSEDGISYNNTIALSIPSFESQCEATDLIVRFEKTLSWEELIIFKNCILNKDYNAAIAQLDKLYNYNSLKTRAYRIREALRDFILKSMGEPAND